MYYQKGQKVNTPQGVGEVSYQRLSAPAYTDAEAVSVYLESREVDRIWGRYSGTLFPAEQVKPI